MKKDDLKIAIVGLGYVGLPLAVAFSKKFKVIGFDINKTRIEELKKGYDNTLEVQNNLLISAANKFKEGEIIQITECNLISKKKRWKVIEK